MRYQHRALQLRPAPAARRASSPQTAADPARTAAPAPRHKVADLSILPPGARPADRTGLPERLRSGIEALSGVAMDGVRVSYNSPHPARLGALAFARGREIHLAAGQEAQLPHEAWHLVQQAKGRVRPTGLAPGRVALNDDPALEREADSMGARAASGPVARAVPEAAPAPAVTAMPIQRQTPWWKKALLGAGMVGGAAMAVAGAVTASPLLAAGGAALAAAGGYGAYRARQDAAERQRKRRSAASRAYQQSLIKLSFAPDAATMTDMRDAMGKDPNVSFANGRITSRYDAQQMLEQYTNAGWKASLSDRIEAGPTRRPIKPNARFGPRTIDAAFSPPGVFERGVKETEDRINRARGQVAGFNYKAHDAARTASVIAGDRNALHKAPSSAAAMTRILARHQGITFGEGHGSPATKQFLHGHLATLAASGVNTLYMEHFRSDHQDHVDQYLASGAMPPELDRFVQNQDNQHNGGQPHLRNILTGARTHGMRVRGIDSQTAASPEGAGQGGTAIRDSAMNNVGYEVITGDRAARAGGKYAILTGAAHNNTQPRTDYGISRGFKRGAMGFSQLLRIPALTIDAKGNPRLDEENRANR